MFPISQNHSEAHGTRAWETAWRGLHPWKTEWRVKKKKDLSDNNLSLSWNISVIQGEEAQRISETSEVTLTQKEGIELALTAG